ncbi:MAG: glycosyltransferase family 4 protein [bacterium]|jgi:glycosyltransferase involved in cell wall biosynthesis|nr:glycosyltransferase family 4 protein [bacterium]
MNILHVLNTRCFGGVETHVLNCLRELKNRGHRAFLIYKESAPGELKEKVENFEIPHAILPLRGVNDIGSLIWMLKFCQQSKMDIIHTHHANEAFRGGIISSLYKQGRFFFTRHGCYGMSKLTLRFLKNASKIIAISDSVKHFLLENGFPPEKVTRIYHGVPSSLTPTEIVPLRKQNLARNPIKLISINRLSEEKDPLLAVEILDWLVTNAPDTNWKLFVLGKDYSNNQAYYKSMTNMIEGRNLADKVELSGYIDDLSEYLKRAHIGVITSRIEGFGLAMIEMMSAGLPVLSTPCEGPLEIIKDGVNGHICRRDPAEFGQKIIDLIGDRERYCQVSRNNVDLYRSEFTTKHMVDELEQLYRSSKPN